MISEPCTEMGALALWVFRLEEGWLVRMCSSMHAARVGGIIWNISRDENRVTIWKEKFPASVQFAFFMLT